MRTLAFVLSLALSPTLLHAVTIHVPADQPTIQAGIDAAVAGDTVSVACGTYYEHDIAMKSGVCLRSETGDPDCAAIHAQSLGRGIVCLNLDGQTSIEGFTIRHAHTEDTDGNGPLPGYGGGVFCSTSSLAIRACRFRDCYAESGGPGIYSLEYSNLLIEDCRFEFNSTIDYGGALGIGHTTASVVGSTFIHNTSNQLGGAVSCTYSTVDFIGCTFAYNEALHGGALRLKDSNISLHGCTLAWNSAQSGAGLYLRHAPYTELVQCLIAHSREGEAIECNYDCDTLILECCDLFGNADGDWTSYIADQLNTNGNIWADPLLCGTFGSQDFTLRSNSACAPSNNSCEALIGAWDVGCGSVSVGSNSWSKVKSLY